MKDIKFRAWDGNKYHYQDNQYLSSFIWRFVRDVNYANGLNSEHEAYLKSHLNEYLEQFTGLKDKNGKEIYEGDIFAYIFDGGMYIGEIVFKDAAFIIEWKKDKWLSDKLAAHVDTAVVVGNIYENKDLLNS